MRVVVPASEYLSKHGRISQLHLAPAFSLQRSHTSLRDGKWVTEGDNFAGAAFLVLAVQELERSEGWRLRISP